jgi:hypothetical protein
VAVYVVLVGVASFAEKPAGRGFGAFQLNALIRAGSLAAAAVALVFAHRRVPAHPDIKSRSLGESAGYRSAVGGGGAAG